MKDRLFSELAKAHRREQELLGKIRKLESELLELYIKLESIRDQEVATKTETKQSSVERFIDNKRQNGNH